jgi:DNA-binding XRE family transcriptional regulator
LAKTLENYRRGRGWSEVARDVQRLIPTVSRGTIRNYETEQRCPEIHVLWALCRVYRAPFGDVADAMVREVLGLEVAPLEAPTMSPEEWALVEDYRRLKDNPARDPWVAIGRMMPTMVAREDDVVG